MGRKSPPVRKYDTLTRGNVVHCHLEFSVVCSFVSQPQSRNCSADATIFRSGASHVPCPENPNPQTCGGWYAWWESFPVAACSLKFNRVQIFFYLSTTAAGLVIFQFHSARQPILPSAKECSWKLGWAEGRKLTVHFDWPPLSYPLGAGLRIG